MIPSIPDGLPCAFSRQRASIRIANTNAIALTDFWFQRSLSNFNNTTHNGVELNTYPLHSHDVRFLKTNPNWPLQLCQILPYQSCSVWRWTHSTAGFSHSIRFTMHCIDGIWLPPAINKFLVISLSPWPCPLHAYLGHVHLFQPDRSFMPQIFQVVFIEFLPFFKGEFCNFCNFFVVYRWKNLNRTKTRQTPRNPKKHSRELMK